MDDNTIDTINYLDSLQSYSEQADAKINKLESDNAAMLKVLKLTELYFDHKHQLNPLEGNLLVDIKQTISQVESEK